MISLSTLANNLQTRLNSNTMGLYFAITADSAEFVGAVRENNDVIDYINGLLKIQTSDVTTLTSGETVATMSCRLQLIVKLGGEEEDVNVIDPDNTTATPLQIIPGNKTKIKNVRKVLTDIFQTNEQDTIIDGGKTYNVSTIYSLVETGERQQVNTIGDSFSFSAYIYYFFVENGLNTNDTEYYLDGKKIPFQANTVFRTPTTEANVYANTKHGEARSVQLQSIFSVSFELPALKNDITKKVFDWIFSGGLNGAHILNIRVPRFSGNASAKDDYYYLVQFGENKAVGETIKNIGQTITLVESIDDYDLVSIPANYYIYQVGVLAGNKTTACEDTSVIEGMPARIYLYNFGDKKFYGWATGSSYSIMFATAKDDIIISTYALTNNGDNIQGLTLIRAGT